MNNNEKEIIPIGEMGRLIGKHVNTLRRWDENGFLKCDHQSPSGKRFYRVSQVNEYLKHPAAATKKVIGYCRVSTLKQKDDLARQEESIRQYLVAQGNPFEIISDIGSGINYTKKGLVRLIELINGQEVAKIVVLYKDRLMRFGFELLEEICKVNSVEIEIVDSTEKTDEEELVEDLVQIITVFGSRLNGRRSRKTKEIIKELTSND